MAFPSVFIDELVARNDIVDVVSDYVTLTPKGGSYWGLCPFHGEKTPSFHVLPDRQLYHCFGCGKGGDVISFVMELENLPFMDSIRLLAKRAGMEVPEDNTDEHTRNHRARLLSLNKEAARYFHRQLISPVGREGLQYLLGRRLSKQTITRFGLGFAPESWDGLISAMTKLGFEKSELLDAGLVVSNKKGGIYDRFRNRVMFPIIDLRGDVIGFGGRVLGDGTPKYLNSPDTPVFNKSRNLFALNLAKTTKIGKLVLTEGYMDTISLHQAGFDCAVASLGTSLTADHAKLLSRFTKEVVICYDADSAGVQAANRAIPLLEKTGLKVRVLRVSGAKDPDEYIKTFGRDAFARLLEQSENHIDYHLRQTMEKYDLNDPAQKAEFAREGAILLAGLDNSVEQEVYAGQLAEWTGIRKTALLDVIRQTKEQRLRIARKKESRQYQMPTAVKQPKIRSMRYSSPRSAQAEEGVIQLLMRDHSLLSETAFLTQLQFSSPVLWKIFSVLRRHLTEGISVQLGSLEGELEPEERDFLADLLCREVTTEHTRDSLRDYLRVMQERSYQRSDDTDDAAVLSAAVNTYQKTKRMGDETT